MVMFVMNTNVMRWQMQAFLVQDMKLNIIIFHVFFVLCWYSTALFSLSLSPSLPILIMYLCWWSAFHPIITFTIRALWTECKWFIAITAYIQIYGNNGEWRYSGWHVTGIEPRNSRAYHIGVPIHHRSSDANHSTDINSNNRMQVNALQMKRVATNSSVASDLYLLFGSLCIQCLFALSLLLSVGCWVRVELSRSCFYFSHFKTFFPHPKKTTQNYRIMCFE